MMKKWCLVGLAIVAMACTSKTTVSVQTAGQAYPEGISLQTRDSIYTLTPDANGVTSVVLADVQPDYATLRCGKMPVLVYVEPGKSFELSFKEEENNGLPVFTGEGAVKNNYLNSQPFHNIQVDYKLDESAFVKTLEEQEASLLSYLAAQKFEPQFVEKEKKRIHYLCYSELPYYPDSYRMSFFDPYLAMEGKLPPQANYRPSERFYKILKQEIGEEPVLSNVPDYQRALTETINTFATQNIEGYQPLLALKNQLAYTLQHYKDPAILDFVINKFVTDYVNTNGIDQEKEYIDIYNANVTTPFRRAALKELYDAWRPVSKGQPSPTFKYLDINGKEVSLDDLKGKYVYIDIWATWCGPCCKEIPYLQKLEHQYAGRNIHFVSISCDKDKAAWEAKVKKDNMGGIQLHTGGDNTFLDTYRTLGVTGIPRFILLDKEGKIIDAFMTRPSDPATVATFNALPGL